MATNPMQRKARNSFLLGMLVMLIITGIVIAFLFMQLMDIKKQEQELKESYVKVYVLSKDVKAGGEITLTDLEETEVVGSNAPKDYLTLADLGEKNMAKIAMTAGTVLSREMIYVDDEQTGDDIRKQEYNVIVLPSQLEDGDYIDVRISLPTGQDYIVVSKKEVEFPKIAGVDSEDTIWLELNESEILAMSSAIVDAYTLKGAKIYAIPYTEPGIQTAATVTYVPRKETVELIEQNSNIVQTAREELWKRYNAVLSQRDNIDSAISNAGSEAQTNLETNLQESITNSKETRKEYLDSLSGMAQ